MADGPSGWRRRLGADLARAAPAAEASRRRQRQAAVEARRDAGLRAAQEVARRLGPDGFGATRKRRRPGRGRRPLRLRAGCRCRCGVLPGRRARAPHTGSRGRPSATMGRAAGWAPGPGTAAGAPGRLEASRTTAESAGSRTATGAVPGQPRSRTGTAGTSPVPAKACAGVGAGYGWIGTSGRRVGQAGRRDVGHGDPRGVGLGAGFDRGDR